MDKILLIDLANAIWRANVSFGPPIQHKVLIDEHSDEVKCNCGSPWNDEDSFCYGQRYNVVFNFFRNLRPQIELHQPGKCFAVVEGHPQFRYDLYSDYKANRLIKKASRVEEQTKVNEASEIILMVLPHLPITIVRAARYEADDLIGTLAGNLQSEDITVLSGDNDYIQLLQRGYAHIQVYNPIKKIYLEAPEYNFLAFRCLVGDKSDNIKGLVSKKKALQFLANPDQFRDFLSLEENRANFAINKKLVEFANVPLDEIEWQDGYPDFQFIFDAFKQMKFESIVNNYGWKKYVETFKCLKY
jgi:5'-3' exonuclease